MSNRQKASEIPSTRFCLLRFMLSILILALLSGCVPIPHTTPRTPEVWGRVVDARTGKPIQGAKVFLVERPHHTTSTDAEGRFRMEATRNFHWAKGAVGGHPSDWPDAKDDSISITHPDYLPSGFLAGGGGLVGDIPLKPKR